MQHALTFKAGPGALALLRRHGFSPDLVRVIAGASGGAKWLVLSQIDRVIASGLFSGRQTPLHLIGSSIGAWRFACHARRDPLLAIERFEDAYIHQRYSNRPTPAEVTRTSRDILAGHMDGGGSAEILSHPFFRTSIMAVRCRALTAAERRPLLMAGLGLSALANAVNRRTLGWFYERALFYDPRARPPFYDVDDLPISRTPLSAENLTDVIVASGAIPMVLDGVRDIAGAPPGVYRDGGIIDYHFDMPLTDEGIVLYPHFFGHLTPGWFDKRLRRAARAIAVDRMLLISPSPAFVQSLPYGRIPDRRDFETMDSDTRIACWQRVVADCRRLADELSDVLATDALAARLQPL